VETSDKITQLENEIKVLKNEVQAVLLDIRENVLNAENPFTAQKPIVTSQVVIDHQVQAPVLPPVSETKAVPIQAAAPVPAPTPAPPVQEQKLVNTALAKEIHVPANNEIEHNHNGRKTAETSETEHESNGRKSQNDNYNQDDNRQTTQYDIELPRFENCESRSDRRPPDLLAYASLACWVEDSTRRLGKERTQAMLEISEVAGFLPPEVKEILTRLTNIKSTEHAYKPTARDYFDSLIKLSAVFGNNNENNAALLLVLAQGDVHG
jgi:hypothetical protein